MPRSLPSTAATRPIASCGCPTPEGASAPPRSCSKAFQAGAGTMAGASRSAETGCSTRKPARRSSRARAGSARARRQILHMTPDGAVPEDNPSEGSLVCSMGHRHPQGLAWDDRIIAVSLRGVGERAGRANVASRDPESLARHPRTSATCDVTVPTGLTVRAKVSRIIPNALVPIPLATNGPPADIAPGHPLPIVRGEGRAPSPTFRQPRRPPP